MHDGSLLLARGAASCNASTTYVSMKHAAVQVSYQERKEAKRGSRDDDDDDDNNMNYNIHQ